MRIGRRSRALLVVMVGGLALSATACGAATDAATTTTTTATATTTATTGGASTGGDRTNGASDGSPAGSPVPQTDRCTTDDLAVSIGAPAQVTTQQRSLPLILTNRSARRCTVTGFPGVDLVAAGGDRYELPRSTQVVPATVSLAPNGRAQATLTYLTVADDDSTAFAATSVQVTPPDETRSSTIAWPGDSVLDQRAATHPGTYISALSAG